MIIPELVSSAFFQIAVGMTAFGMGLEYFIPARRDPGGSSRILNLLYAAIVIPVSVLWLAALSSSIIATVIEWVGFKHVFDLSFDTSSSIALAIAAVVVSTIVFDLFFYAYHRAQHTFGILWQVHAMHHTDEQMNITTTQRIHILEYVFAPVLVTGPMTILFNLPAPSIAVLASLPTLWTFFTHANVRVSFGPLWWMLASPQYHRIHHSIEPQHLNRNFAAYFPLWDIVFGTAYRPKPGEYPMTGVDGLKVSNLWSAFALPFEGWARLYWRRGGGNSREELGSEELGSESSYTVKQVSHFSSARFATNTPK